MRCTALRSRLSSPTDSVKEAKVSLGSNNEDGDMIDVGCIAASRADALLDVVVLSDGLVAVAAAEAISTRFILEKDGNELKILERDF